jgi:HPr kinase/phosphorylase
LRRTLEFPIPCVIITTSLEAVPEMVQVMREMKLPLLRTSHITSPFQAELSQFLERRLAPRWLVHGVMVEVFGLGVLIQGRSGVGKSECGLDLVDRGHLMVADDVVLVRRMSPGRLFAGAAPTLGYHMEIRGIGIIDVQRLFGARSVREESELSLVVELERWDPNKEYERLGLAEDFISLFECRIARVVLPVEPGRNIAQLIEIAALTQRLRGQGIDVPGEFDRRIRRMTERRV